MTASAYRLCSVCLDRPAYRGRRMCSRCQGLRNELRNYWRDQHADMPACLMCGTRLTRIQVWKRCSFCTHGCYEAWKVGRPRKGKANADGARQVLVDQGTS